MIKFFILNKTEFLSIAKNRPGHFNEFPLFSYSWVKWNKKCDKEYFVLYNGEEIVSIAQFHINKEPFNFSWIEWSYLLESLSTAKKHQWKWYGRTLFLESLTHISKKWHKDVFATSFTDDGKQFLEPLVEEVKLLGINYNYAK